MFIYGPRAVDVKSGGHGSLGRAALDIKSIVVANKWLLAALAITGALVGFAAAKLLPHKYVATTEIYIHPGSLSGGDKDVLAPGEDSNGFISYVESQVLIIKSRDVLERVVAEEKLDTDPDFAQASWLSEGSASLSTDADRANAAVAVLDTRITIRRPERTFVIELSVTDKDPVKAARLANATARGYIETVSALQLDASRQTETLLAGPLETYRARVLEAEKKVEDYKAAKGLVGTRDAYVTEQQLKDTNAQITAARTKAARRERRSHRSRRRGTAPVRRSRRSRRRRCRRA
jgi:succinoglycan biosynthesis transport protein ExoP